jgi:hypothetical protein
VYNPTVTMRLKAARMNPDPNRAMAAMGYLLATALTSSVIVA